MICSRCQVDKSEDQFTLKNRATGQRQSCCRSCRSEIGKEWYAKNKDRHVASTKRNKAKFLGENRKFLLDYLLRHPCVDCGEKDPIVLTFDHVRGTKRECVSVSVVARTLPSLKAEVDKCEVRCFNCHARKTARERGNWKLGAGAALASASASL